MQTIVELPEYKKRALKFLSEKENTEVISFLAKHPESGVLMQGTGAIRKLRWATESSGKSSGVRVIYYYYNKTLPLFLLSIGKNEKANLSQAERNTLAKLTTILRNNYGNKK